MEETKRKSEKHEEDEEKRKKNYENELGTVIQIDKQVVYRLSQCTARYYVVDGKKNRFKPCRTPFEVIRFNDMTYCVCVYCRLAINSISIGRDYFENFCLLILDRLH